MTRDEALTAEEVEGINNKNRYNINPVINKDSELLSRHILELQADKGKLIDENKDLNETIDKLREQLALRYDLEDKVAELKETLAQTIENDEIAYETLKLHAEEEIAMLKAQIEKMKCCENCHHHFFNSYDVMECAEGLNVTSKRCDKWECRL